MSGCNVRKHHSGFDSYGSCFSSSCLFCDYLLAVEGDIFAGGGVGGMLIDSKRPWNEIYDGLSLSKTYWVTQVVIEKTDNCSSDGLQYQS